MSGKTFYESLIEKLSCKIGFVYSPEMSIRTKFSGPRWWTNNFITSSGSPLADFEQETDSELLTLHCWLKANKLSLNAAKTKFIVILALARNFLRKTKTK